MVDGGVGSGNISGDGTNPQEADGRFELFEKKKAGNELIDSNVVLMS